MSVAGRAAVNPEISLSIDKVDIARFFDTTILGGTPGLVLTVPYGWGAFGAQGVAGSFSAQVEDKNRGFVDLAGTAILGRHEGKLHTSVRITAFAPTADYALAVVTFGPPSVDNLLNFSKNRWALLPFAATTWLDPATGLEFSGTVSLETSFRNEATEWQSAPILNFETAATQHLEGGWALGVAGYFSRQLGEDSGMGPDQFKQVVNAESLQARIFGVGPILTYQTKVLDTSVNMKLKFTREFGAERRFESDIFTAAIGVSF